MTRLLAARVSWLNAEALIAAVMGCAVSVFHALHLAAVAPWHHISEEQSCFGFRDQLLCRPLMHKSVS